MKGLSTSFVENNLQSSFWYYTRVKYPLEHIQPMFVDAHIHLSDPALKDLLPQIILEAKITRTLLIAVAEDTSTSALNLKIAAEAGEVVKPFLGVHPWSLQNEGFESEVMSLEPERFAGVGEVGLDRKYARDDVEYRRQREVFEYMLRLAERLQKPLSIHSRGSVDDVLSTLTTYHLRGVLLHWFSGAPNQLKVACDRGYYISYGPAVIYSKKTKQLASSTPPDLILTETDGPVKFGGVFQNRIALPAFIPSIIFTLSSLHKLGFEEMRSIIFENALNYLGSKYNK
ncbi:MAG: TatD family hydrolase [Thaumarchaeota archaeon]|nr:TatD family hydrolase [Nitrososphaerota archaeon]